MSLELKIADSKPLYSETLARAEANRCLYCYDAPCIKACPTDIDIPSFIRQIATDNIKGSAKAILRENILGYSCARVCPVEVLCVGSCVYNTEGQEPIQIGRLQRYATEIAFSRYDMSQLLSRKKASTHKSVAFVGAGPASLAAAAMLSLEGHKTVIFEGHDSAGGLNALGVAPYKLHKHDAQAEVDLLVRLGVEIRLDSRIEADSARALMDNFDAVFLGMGIGNDSMLDIEGAKGEGVFGATELIERIKSDANLRLVGSVARVIGGGNTAIDIAHELKLLGFSQVTMVYRKAESEMSGYRHELNRARESGVQLLENAVPKREESIRELTRVVALELACGTQLPTDLVVMAIGQKRNAAAIAHAFPNVEISSQGLIIVDPATHRTHNPKVWSAGDCTNGGKEVVNAVAEAKIAVKSMLEYLKQ